MMKKNRILYLICLCVVCPSCFSSRGTDTSDNDGSSGDSGNENAANTSLLGTWQGEVNSVADIDDAWSFEFDETEVTVSVSGTELYRGRYHVNESVVPNQADFIIENSSIPQYEGKTSLAIYKMEGNTLIVAAAEPGTTERPQAFVPSDDGIVIVFELVKQ